MSATKSAAAEKPVEEKKVEGDAKVTFAKQESGGKDKDAADSANQAHTILGRYGSFKTSGNIAKDSKDAKRKVTISKLDEAKTILQMAIRHASSDQYFWIAALLSTATLRISLVKVASRMVSQINRAIHTRDGPSFQTSLVNRFAISIAVVGATQAVLYVQNRLAQVWHIGLTKQLHDRYFSKQMFFHLGRANMKDGDQRIAVDAQETLLILSQIAEKLVTTFSLGTYFTGIVAREIGLASAVGPWVFVYAMKKLTDLVPLDWRRLAGLMEFQFGMYRGQHNRLAQHGEAVAALQGAELEGNRLRDCLEKTEQAQRIFWNALNTYITSQGLTTQYAPMVFSPLVVLFPFLKQRQNTAETMATATYQIQIFLEAMTATGSLASSLLDLQRVGGNAKRVTDLLAAFDKIDAEQAEASAAFRQGTDSIEFSGVDVVTPNGHTLVEDLSFKLEKGNNLIIVGHNGAGKSSIFRCLGGLWQVKKGTITKPGTGTGLHGEVFYIPQKPYNLVGTLEEQVAYPKFGTKMSKDQLANLLEIVDLKYLLEREGEVDWERVLSLGEQQRLAMVRLLFHSPKFAVLDECTSAVSAEMERRFYTFCADRSITCITISHRPALQHFHDQVLSIGIGKKGYKLDKIVKTAQTEVRQATIVGAGALVQAPPPKKQKLSFFTYVKRVIRVLGIAKDKNFELKILGSVVISAANTAIGNAFSILMAGLYSSVLTNDVGGFSKRAVGLCVWAVVMSLARTVNRVHQCHLGTDLRMQLSRSLLNYYLQQSGFYRLKNANTNSGAPFVPDPEIRLGVDVREWAVTASSFCTTFPTLCAETVWWGIALSKVAGAKYALGIYGYAAVTSLALRNVMPRYREIIERNNRIEGAYRSEHSSVLASAESIAFFGGGAFEREVVERRFRDLMKLKRSTMYEQTRYKVTSGFFFGVLPTHFAFFLQNMLAQQVSEGALLGAVQQQISIAVERMFESVAYAQEFVESFEKFTGSTNRVYEFLEAMDALPIAGSNTKPSEDISFPKVDLTTPAGVCLAKSLDVTVKRGESLMITGPNGCGKSSFFRALGGMWPLPGTLYRPPRGLDVFLVPQKPFLTSPGTLAEQVLYPDPLPEVDGKRELTDELKTRLTEIMKAVGLQDLLDREGWSAQAKDNELSLGEQQRLGMARLFYHRPVFAVLDECTSAVSAEVEVSMYANAHRLGITMITLSQRLALREYHTRELQMGLPSAGWVLRDISTEKVIASM